MVGNNTKLAALDWWQNRAEAVQPLVCDDTSCRGKLIEFETEEGNLYLECSECSYMQFHFPDYIVEDFLRNMALGAAMVGYVDEEEE